MKDVLTAQDISVKFGGTTVLNHVNFKLKKGDLRCLIGPNGAGKSTLFNCLSGLLQVSEGHVFVRDNDCTQSQCFWFARLGIGIKTQVPSLMDGLDVFENIWLAARSHLHKDAANKNTYQVIERLGLADIQHQIVNTLAHGRRQFVELAMVLAQKPSIILLDEPAAGMSDSEMVKLIEIIREMNQTASIVVVEHDMQFVRDLASEITVLHRGQIVLEGSADDVLSSEYVQSIYLGQDQS